MDIFINRRNRILEAVGYILSHSSIYSMIITELLKMQQVNYEAFKASDDVQSLLYFREWFFNTQNIDILKAAWWWIINLNAWIIK